MLIVTVRKLVSSRPNTNTSLRPSMPMWISTEVLLFMARLFAVILGGSRATRCLLTCPSLSLPATIFQLPILPRTFRSTPMCKFLLVLHVGRQIFILALLFKEMMAKNSEEPCTKRLTLNSRLEFSWLGLPALMPLDSVWVANTSWMTTLQFVLRSTMPLSLALATSRNFAKVRAFPSRVQLKYSLNDFTVMS